MTMKKGITMKDQQEQKNATAFNAYHNASAHAKAAICKDVLDLSGLIFDGLDKAAKQFSETNKNFKGSTPVFMMSTAIKIISDLLDKDESSNHTTDLINELKDDSIKLLEDFVEDLGPISAVLGGHKHINFLRLLGEAIRLNMN